MIRGRRDTRALLDQRLSIFELAEAAQELEQTCGDVIRLTLGQCELPVHPEITRAMTDALADDRRSSLVYPLGLPSLRAAIAEYESQGRVMPVESGSVIVSAGSSLIFRNLCTLCTLLGPEGGAILIPRPYCPLYRYSAALAGAPVVLYDLDPFTGALDLGSLEAGLAGGASAIVICSPGNPLGNVLDADDLERIDAVVDGRAVIISDEIYRNLCFEERAPSMGTIAAPRSPVIVTSAFSKGFRLSAQRVGYAVVPGEFLAALGAISAHTVLTTDPVPQFGALEALRHPSEVEMLRALYRNRRDYAYERLSAVPTARPIRPSGGFYLTVDVAGLLRPGETDRSLARAILAGTHVAVVPGSDFGLPGCLRLSFTASQFEIAVDRLARYLAGDRVSVTTGPRSPELVTLRG